ncbi:glycosyltransferase family 2 protein [Vibrio sp. SCSIO 43140]|uniref:glycosyltransferase family 2 protein n=1 Tax=Vibrio sp. SCSIO 43140 TaxID=2819100 RepID=UPI002074FB87|nr:glycosyltransferase family 2 protein [Vibrio sp. SCSIO 43140]USD60280.1 glycosyltransferase family 2 protein [Vibrio sp. SCSIO 43140]
MDNVAIITVAYNPDLDEIRQNINSYVNQAGLVILVDNSDDIDKIRCMKKAFSDSKQVHLISLGGNYGIARAQNIGFEFALGRGFNFFIEMDQDSSLPNRYIERIHQRYISLTDSGINVAGIGPTTEFRSEDLDDSTNSECKEAKTTLSSGFFSSRDAFIAIGGKDEDLFIDLVDWDWCWRAWDQGYRVFVDHSLVICHRSGDGHKKIGYWYFGVSSPFRLYYQFRNSLYMMRKGYVPFSWKLKRLFILLTKPFIYLIFYDKKILRLKYIFRAILDFLKNKKGSLT